MPKIVDHDVQRLQLSATVARVVAEDGLDYASLRTVAARHGCTKGMVQHYFDNKGDLLLAALEYIEACCAIRLENATLDKQSALDALITQLNARLPLDEERLGEWAVRIAFMSRVGQNREIHHTLFNAQQDRQREGLRLLRQAQKASQLRKSLSPANAYRLLNTLVEGMALAVVGGDEQWSAAVQKRTLKDAVDSLRR
ncbi:MAG: TetR/AcrR family transcriptional regulator [Parahaliea sp.]